MHPRYAQSPRFSFSAVEQEGILYDTETQNVVHLDAHAVIVWSLCDGARSADDIVAMLRAAYPEAAATLDGDVRTTLQTLAQAGAITELP